jgi:uncharacterized protein YcaQ
MAALQIDTIHVVARSPYLVLWSRLSRYDPVWLDELLAEGKLFEYWAHAACFLPIEYFGLYRRRMLDEMGRFRAWLDQHPDRVAPVLERLRAAGPVRSSDWERTDGRAGSWWDWKPEKHVLELLYYVGDIMIARRERFQRIYDLRERVLPEWDDAQTPSAEEARRALVLQVIRALGVTKARWVPDYFKMKMSGIPVLVEQLADEGQVIRVEVEGWDVPGYVHPDHAELAQAASAGTLAPARTTLLSPFDPVVWDRARAQQLFDFNYRIEVYTPAPKRRYGYFTLPILHRNALVGRLDPKAHRKEKVLEVRAIHLEPNVPVTDDLVGALRTTLCDFAGWQDLANVVVRQSDPPELAEALGLPRDM